MKRVDRLQAKKRRKKEMAVQVILAVVLVGGLVAGIMNFSAIKMWAMKRYVSMALPPPIAVEEEPELYPELKGWDPSKSLNILLIGIDKGSVPGESGYTRSDVMILLSVNVEKKRAVIVSIPRDTKVTIPGYGTEKINAAHSLNGPTGAVQTVKELSGMDIHHYAEVDFEAFKEVVDAMGGVPFHVETTINDPKVGYLPKGDYNLDGKGALIVCRSRDYPDGDLERIENQKRFLKAVMEKAITIRDIKALKGMLDAAVRYMKTTIPPATIFTLAELLQGMKVDDVEFATVPGYSPTPGYGQPWYYVYDQQATAQLFYNVSNYSSVMTPEEEAAQKALQQQQQQQQVAAQAAEAAAEEAVDRSTVSLAVLNGARSGGVASDVAELMNGKGYKNIKTGNTKNTYTETTFYYAAGHEAEARVAARDLDANKDYKVVLDADVTTANKAGVVLVLGKDYSRL